MKALALMPAVEASEAEIIVMADADCLTDGIPAAIEAVENGAMWAIPHRGVHRLSERGTAGLFAGEPWEAQEIVQPPYMGMRGGGIVVARREAILAAPMDPRFTEWGHEDESWALALETLIGDPWLGKRPLIHCWHPPAQRLSRRRGSMENWALYYRYRKASGNRQAMEGLVYESRNAAQQDGLDHDALGLRR